MRAQGSRPSIGSILDALRLCGASKDVENGQRVHAEVTEAGYCSNLFVANALVDMYVKCSRMEEAHRVFASMPQRTAPSWNSLMLGYAANGKSLVALELYSQMQKENCRPNTLTFVAALRACTAWADKEQGELVNGKLVKLGCLERGKSIHFEAIANGQELSASLLVNFYAKCGSMVDALNVFEACKNPSVVCWSVMILGYAQSGEGELGLQLFQRMQEQGCVPNHVTLLAALKACGSLTEHEEAQQVNGEAVKIECLKNCRIIHSHCRVQVEISVASSLIDVYAKCGSIADAREVFDSIARPDVVACNCMIMGYAITGKGRPALKLFSRMQHQGLAPDGVTYVAALKACGSLADQETGAAVNGKLVKAESLRRSKQVHLQALKTEKRLDIFLASALVDTYARCGSMVDAREVFEKIQPKDAVLWGTIVLGYTLTGEFQMALELFKRLHYEGCSPNATVVSAAVKACSGMTSKFDKRDLLEQGKNIHRVASRSGQSSNIMVANALIDMYAKCGSLEDAFEVFKGIQQPTVVSWNCVILGYVQNGNNLQALELYQRMQDHGCTPNGATYVSALNACAGLGEMEEVPEKKQRWLEQGRDIHSLAEHTMDVFVASALVDMYAKCGSLVEARQVFDSIQHRNVVSWTAIIQGYARCGKGEVALELFRRMQDEGCSPDQVTIIAALKTCSNLVESCGPLKILEKGRAIHRQAVNLGDTKKLGCVLVDLYAKCGSMVEALQVFEGMDPCSKDTVAWTALLQGYTQAGAYEHVLELYKRMKAEDVPADSLTYVTVLKACSSMAALESGREIHSEIRKAGPELPEMVANSLVDFYGKCGSMAEAEEVFSVIRNRDVFSWGSLIAGYSRQGNTARVFEMFHRMQDEDRLQPNTVIYLSVLTACSHAGIVSEGKMYFDQMASSSSDWLKPGIEHYNCMIDMLGRANRLEEAVQLATRMPVAADEVTWTSLLAACLKWKNVELGRFTYERMQQLEGGGSAAAFVLMSRLYESTSKLVKNRV